MVVNQLRCFELTLALIKPDCACMPHCLSWLEKKIRSNNFFVLEHQETYWSKATAKRFYKQHENKFFYRRLVDSMSSGPIFALVLSKDNAISQWRSLIGPTKVYQTQYTNPDSFRGIFGLSDTRNGAHGSDSDQSAFDEISLVFPNFDYEFWKRQNYEELENILEYNPDKKVHYLSSSSRKDNANTLFGSTSNQETLSKNLGKPGSWTDYYGRKIREDNSWQMEWFSTYENIKPYLHDILEGLNKEDKTNLVIDIGCGTSRLGTCIADCYPKLSVHCLDVALDGLRMSAFNSYSPQCTFVNCDVTDGFAYRDNSVSLLIDKGLSDVISRHRSPDAINKLCYEVVRVLEPGGCYVQVTTDCPDIRMDMISCIRDRVHVSYLAMDGVESNELPIFIYRITKI